VGKNPRSVLLSTLKVLLDHFAVLGSFPLRCLSSFLPSWTWSEWWSAFLRHTFNGYTVPCIVHVLTLLALLELCCCFATMSLPPSMVFL